MTTQRITFTEWTPDLPSIVENLSVAKNVIPASVGYVPFPTAVDYSLAASETLNNVFAGRFNATTVMFAGGETKLFKLDSSDFSLDDVSKSVARSISNVALTSNVATITTGLSHGYSTGDSVTVDASNNTFDGTYTITSVPSETTFTYAKVAADVASAAATGTVIDAGYSAVTKWNFIQFGNTIIAANNKDKLQSYSIGSSTYFGDLATNAPVAKFVTVVRDFVVAANIDTGVDANKVQWSDINDETNWNSTAASQSDFQIIADGGNIRGITGGEFGLVLLDRAIVRMSYIGSPFFFQFDTIARGIGCVEGSTVTKYGNTTYFLGEEGFYACDGQTVTPIGNEKVDRWFWDNANPSKLDTMSVTTDSFRKVVVWNFLDNFGKRNLIMYNWQVQKWSYGTTDVDYVSSAASAGATLEGMDAYGNMDTITTSFDSPLFSGGKTMFAGARGAKIVTFTGANAEAQIDTGLIGSQYPSVVTLARPLIDDGSSDVAIASQVLLNQVVDFGTYVSADSENRVSLRSAGKYHKLSIKPTGDRWSNIIGVDVEIVNQGTR